MVTVAPGTPLAGLKLVIVGAPVPFVTVNVLGLLAVPAGAVTLTVPVVAPFGTATISCEVVDEDIVAVVPLKVTVF